MVHVNRRGYTHHSNVQILSALNNNNNTESKKQILIILLSCVIETLGLFMRDLNHTIILFQVLLLFIVLIMIRSLPTVTTYCPRQKSVQAMEMVNIFSKEELFLGIILSIHCLLLILIRY